MNRKQKLADENNSFSFLNFPWSQLIYIFTSVIFLSYTLGFVIWNIHLAIFSFFESEFLQTRFLSSGLVFVAISTPLAIFATWVFKYIFKVIQKISIELLKKFLATLLKLLAFFLTMGWLLIYTYAIFPHIGQALGGAQPFVKALIADGESIKFLSDLNFSVEVNSGRDSIQTSYVCEIYSNKDQIIVGTTVDDVSRLLIFNKNLFIGFQGIPPAAFRDALKNKCKNFIVGF